MREFADDLRDLVARARLGELDAFATLVRRFQGMAVGYARDQLRDAQLAEDAAQEAFIEAFAKLDQLREPAAFAGWFKRIVFKHCDRQRRARPAAAPLDAVAHRLAAPTPDPAELAESGERDRRIRAAVRTLPENQQTAVALYYMNGLSQKEIAAAIGAPLATVKYRLNAARKRLTKELDYMARDQDDSFVANVIDGVKTLGWGTDRECTFAGALEAALDATDHPCTYADIMGLSGLAFRVRWLRGGAGQRRWCASSPCGEFPEEIEAISRATGWPLRVINELTAADARVERYAPDIVASIDAGRPVLAYEPKYNMDVIFGYEEAGTRLRLKDYFAGDKDLVLPIGELGPFMIFLGEHGDPLPPDQALRRALAMAVDHWSRGPAGDIKGTYWYGEKGLARWAEDLGLADDLEAEERNLLFFVSNWNFDSLYDARYAAMRFLNRALDRLGESAARQHLQNARDLYSLETGLLQTPFAHRDFFLGPWTGKTVEDWSPAARRREQLLLREAAKLEAQAVAELAGALTALKA